jgi:CubicO group peptidase (beta-lactamase class C family)
MDKMQPNRMDDVIQSYVKDQEFMGSALVARDKDILLSKGYGCANLEWNIPNTPKTKYRLGSLTKQFTAAAILLLEERGLLKTEDFIGQHLPNAPATWKNIKIFHLLNHTHGIPNYTQFPEFRAITAFKKTPLEQVQLFIDKPLDFEPGTQYVYNNSGYVLLGYLIEVLSSQTYEAFLQEHVFNPLEMQDSGYDSHSAIIPQRAEGYTKDDVGMVTNAEYLDMSLPYAAGSLYSTTEDLLKWTQGLFSGRLLSLQSLDKMTQPFKESYGFGVEINRSDDIKMISHIGGINGFNTILIYCPETKASIVVLSNLNTIGYVWDIGFLSKNIALKLAALAHGKKVVLPFEKREIKIQPNILEQYVGLYETKPNMNLEITLENGQLEARFAEQGPILLLAESETVFYAKIPDIGLKFLKNEKSTATHVNLSQSGYELLGTRI